MIIYKKKITYPRTSSWLWILLAVEKWTKQDASISDVLMKWIVRVLVILYKQMKNGNCIYLGGRYVPHTHTYTLTDNYGTVTVELGAGNKVTKAI